jgi:hypothetical protein
MKAESKVEIDFFQVLVLVACVVYLVSSCRRFFIQTVWFPEGLSD